MSAFSKIVIALASVHIGTSVLVDAGTIPTLGSSRIHEGWTSVLIGSATSWLRENVCSWSGACQRSSCGRTKGIWHGSAHDEEPSLWDHTESSKRDIPQYVLDHAPLVHLFSAEEFWPCDIKDHLLHITPHLNYTPLQSQSEHPVLTNLNELNQWDGGFNVYLQSNDNVEERPKWLAGRKNIPAKSADAVFDSGTPEQRPLSSEQEKASERRPGRSDAPAVLVVINKPDGIVDAFWFYFYSYNLGNVVLGARYGNHVGDWEHTLVRFQHGRPTHVFLSEHYFGEAYTYDAVEKIGRRPVVYSAEGSHAMYGTPGVHNYILPFGLLHDETDRGPLWDPVLNSHIYTYDYRSDELRSSSLTPDAPTQWFYFTGHWGDRIYPLSDPRQYAFAGNYHYVSGPLGPRFKNLGRTDICQGNGHCEIRRHLEGSDLIRVHPGTGEGETMNPEDELRFRPRMNG